LLVAIAFFSVFVILSFQSWNTLEQRSIPMDLKVISSGAGMNADTDALHFGALVPGASSSRTITLTPIYAGRLVIRLDGDLESWVVVDKNHVDLFPGEEVSLTFTATPPPDAAIGYYDGEARFFIYRV
jgi:hypothetical protein